MYANEVKKRHVERDSGLKMVKALAESQAQPSETAKMRSHAQICAFDMRCADSFNLRVSADGDWDSRGNFRGVVPLRAFSVVRSVELEQLGEVNIRSKVFFDGGNVTAETIGRKLESACDSFAQVPNEVIGARSFPLRNEIGQDHFGVGINRHPNILVAPLFRRIAVQVSLFRMNESPEFVGLHESRTDSAYVAVEEAAALLPDREKQRENRSLVSASNPRNSADTHSFKQERGDLRRLVGVCIVPSQRPLARLRKRGVAAGAAITLNSLASVESESFCFVVLASQAGHVASPLVFLREKPDNQSLGSECGHRPRLDSASLPAQTGGGALFRSFLLSQIWKKFYRMQAQIGFQLVCARPNPLEYTSPPPRVRQSIITRSDFSVFQHSFQRRMHARHHILVLTEVMPPAFQLLLDFNGTNRFRINRSKNFSNSLSRSCGFGQEIPSYALFFGERGKGHNGLLQLSDFLLSILLVFEKRFQFFPHLANHPLVILSVHRESI